MALRLEPLGEISENIGFQQPYRQRPVAGVPLDPGANPDGVQGCAAEVVKAICPAEPIHVEYFALDISYERLKWPMGCFELVISKFIAVSSQGAAPHIAGA